MRISITENLLADRIIRKYGGLTDREMRQQVLDSMDIEGEVSVKAQTVKLKYKSRDGAIIL